MNGLVLMDLNLWFRGVVPFSLPHHLAQIPWDLAIIKSNGPREGNGSIPFAIEYSLSGCPQTSIVGWLLPPKQR